MLRSPPNDAPAPSQCLEDAGSFLSGTADEAVAPEELDAHLQEPAAPAPAPAPARAFSFRSRAAAPAAPRAPPAKRPRPMTAAAPAPAATAKPAPRVVAAPAAAPAPAGGEADEVIDPDTVEFDNAQAYDPASDHALTLESAHADAAAFGGAAASGSAGAFGDAGGDVAAAFGDGPQPVPALEVRDEMDFAGPPAPIVDPYTEGPRDPAAAHLDELRAATGEEPTTGGASGDGLELESGSAEVQDAPADAGSPEQQRDAGAGDGAGADGAGAGEPADPLSQQELYFDAARDSAKAVREAVADPGATNFGTGPSGVPEKVPVVWTLPPVGGACKAGYFLDGRLCRRCAQGHVRGEGAGECKICPPGTYADVTRQECRPCARGNYAYCESLGGGRGAWRPVEARQGHARRSGLRAAAETAAAPPLPHVPAPLPRPPPPAGHASTRCLWCLPGSYADQPGSVLCKPCPEGTKSGYQAARCT
jgi:hypothetical protein